MVELIDVRATQFIGGKSVPLLTELGDYFIAARGDVSAGANVYTVVFSEEFGINARVTGTHFVIDAQGHLVEGEIDRIVFRTDDRNLRAAIWESDTGLNIGVEALLQENFNDTLPTFFARYQFDLDATGSQAKHNFPAGVTFESFGASTHRGGDGHDVFRGGIFSDRLAGNAGRDTLLGGGGNDRLFGGDNADILKGGSGHDRLGGGRGADTMTGASGRDTLVFNLGYGRDTVLGFAPSLDTLELHDTLWAAELTARRVVNRFATLDGDGTRAVFDFGDGDILIVEGQGLTANRLANAIDIV